MDVSPHHEEKIVVSQEKTVMIRNWKGSIPLLLILLCSAPPARAQQPSMEELIKQIQSLSQSVSAMQKELQEIKTLLQSRAPQAPAPPPQNVLLDLTGRPSLGENTAKLTLVEFSDYQ